MLEQRDQDGISGGELALLRHLAECFHTAFWPNRAGFWPTVLNACLIPNRWVCALPPLLLLRGLPPIPPSLLRGPSASDQTRGGLRRAGGGAALSEGFLAPPNTTGAEMGRLDLPQPKDEQTPSPGAHLCPSTRQVGCKAVSPQYAKRQDSLVVKHADEGQAA